MDEVEVDLVHAEPVEALVEGAQDLGGGFVTVLRLRPQLGGEEHIAALDAGLLRADAQFFADNVVIGVDLGGVDVPIPGREGVPDGGRGSVRKPVTASTIASLVPGYAACLHGSIRRTVGVLGGLDSVSVPSGAGVSHGASRARVSCLVAGCR
ncbi:hypothetical protein ACWEQK_12690 [Streptomyces parvulus]